MAQRRSTDVALQMPIAYKFGRRLLAQAQGVVVGRGTGEVAAGGVYLPRYAAIDEQELATRTQLERQAPGTGRAGEHHRWGRPGVDEDGCRSPLQSHVA